MTDATETAPALPFDIINQAVAEIMSPAFVEEKVRTRVEKLVVESVDDALRSYSPIAKLIKEAVAAALQVNQLDLPSYGSLVTGLIEREVKANASALIDARLAEDIRELLSSAPAEIKLSEIAQGMIDEGDFTNEYGEAITVILGDAEYSSRWLYLDDGVAHKERDKHSCKVKMLLRADGTIACAHLNDRDLKDIKFLGRSYGIQDRVRAWYAAGTKIILDEDAVVTSVGD